ncbi:MAG: hypothetical protein US57_C0002G0005 [Candidatus Moranbacteria bacterium GW2011_GWC2_37_73]|nr:MAG: hypothetical protein UR95_C0002G0103 [Parcubacteria group bacterium GW2011_GWC1_36_108]KKQ01054.1 MAG: hypothetical protein US09_C0003G0054 [Candidatus Moranbacteria bacterium GW2011_GWD1_36_198]KKQ02456.1 MAG: hypothetical protein US10_C0001G0054 [Candidatus Moranbacteria bacterium GW2011_GWD2_36_198]KKQ40298.1 MAG: hypothetical protein US57_C0002G0005 [Candidatus Moranbacteria bacterium GW2011_GWC2_37_73]HAS00265.1 hypothetical protein [Candidatus Moranbacteria bacterium]
MKVLSKEAMMRMFELAQNSYRPLEIVKLIEEIDGETRAAELVFSITGILDKEHALKIVKMMLEKDRLYALWAKGEIG